MGLCHRIPGLDYRNFEYLGPDLPDKRLYTAVCKDCWPTADTDFGSGSSGSSVSSSEPDAPPAEAKDDSAA